MKRITALLLSLLLLAAALPGCSMTGNRETVRFYYHQSGSTTGVIVPEDRELSGYRDNLPYLMTLYFHGPMEEDLRSPFPSGTAVLDIRTEEDTLVVTLSSAFLELTGMELSIASVCLAKTCFDLTGAEAVRIESDSIATGETLSTTLTRDSFLLEDTLPTSTAPSS